MNQASEKIIFTPFIDALGGVERLVIDLSRLLHERDIPHTVACFKQTIDLQQYSDRPLDVHELLPKRNSLLEAMALKKFLKSGPFPKVQPLLFDLKSAFYSGLAPFAPFVLHLTDPPSLLPADVSKYAPSARSFAEFRRLPRVNTARAMRAELVHRLNLRGVRRASKVIAMTEKIKGELLSLYGVEAVVVRPGVSISDSTSTVRRKPSPPFRMLSVSRLEPNKRIDWVLRALATINDRELTKPPDWKLEIVGDGTERESLEKLAAGLGLESQVVFLGHLSEGQLAAAYSRAGLFLMPAVQGYGLPALEALSRGIPTIVHKNSGVSEILGANSCVEIVDGNNGSLTKAITVMLNHLRNDEFTGFTMPPLPTSSEWASNICRECGWLPASMM